MKRRTLEDMFLLNGPSEEGIFVTLLGWFANDAIDFFL